jgi:hypothetical protein
VSRWHACFFVLVAFVALQVPASLAADAEPSYPWLPECDGDKNRSIDDAELLECILNRKKIEFQQLLLTKEIKKLIGNNCVEVERTVETLGEPEDLTTKIKFLLAEDLNDECFDAKTFLQDDPPYTFEQMARYWNLQPTSPPPAFLVRRNVQDAALLPDARALTGANGALLAYSRNDLDDSQMLHLEGAFIFYRPWKPAGQWLRASAPSLSFRRIEIDREGLPSSAGELDELIARQTFHFLSRGGAWDHELRLGAAFLTDFDFDRQIAALEADWQPFALGTCFAHFRTWRSVQYRCGFGVRAEAGEVLDGGEFSIPEEAFARIGPNLAFHLQRAPWTLSFRYQYRLELEGEADDTDLFRAGLDVSLDPAGHWTFNAAYERGELPISLRSVRTLVVGVGVRY